jgi:hypothetical protein
MDLNEAIRFGELINAAYAIPPADLTNSAGKVVSVGATTYTVVTTIYASDLATDMNPARGNFQVSIGLVFQDEATGNVVIAIRGTEGILEWIHDVQFNLVPCPFLASAGKTEDGFTIMYNSLRTNVAIGSPSVVSALASLPFKKPVASVTISGHSLGGALVTLLALDLEANSIFKNPTVYTFASPRTGDPAFVSTYNQMVPATYRIANRLDLVPKLPPSPMYDHVQVDFELNPVRLLPLPPKILVNPTIACEHNLDSYLHLLSMDSGGALVPLDPECVP